MKPRIAISLDKEGTLQILLNETGRARLIQALERLDETHEHIHLSTDDWADVELQSAPYQPDDKVIEYGKVQFRTDAWDKMHYPHVLD